MPRPDFSTLTISDTGVASGRIDTFPDHQMTSEKPMVTIFRITSGNVVGVIEQPKDFDPDVPMSEQQMVKIGVLDRDQEMVEDDALDVSNRLRNHLEHVATPIPRLERFAFHVTAEADQATVMMDLGRVVRSRVMPLALLHQMSKVCSQLVDASRDARESSDKVEQLSYFPGCSVVAEGTIGGVCKFTLTIAKLEDDTVEFTIAFYDAEDDSAPVLVLAEEQVEDFIRLVSEIPPQD